MDLAALEAMVEQRRTPKGPDSQWLEKLPEVISGELKLAEPLKRYTSIQIGGPAEALVFPQDEKDLSHVLAFAKEHRVPWWVLGRGSNVLVRDGGVPGITIQLADHFQSFEILEENENEICLEVGAGYPLPKLVEQGRKAGWQGVVPLYGVPASVGGALWMNAGNRQGEIKDVVEAIKVVKSDGELAEYPAKRLQFSYRHMKMPDAGVVVAVRFRFTKGDTQALQQDFSTYQKKRKDTQPLDYPNLGSVFKNPEKGFAAQIIEELGLKGVRVGGARLSEKHANFIINEREATALDVLAMMGLIKDKVWEECQIKLELEAKIIGVDET